ncbi:hypothetical protein KQI36_15945 [Clostridium senegalense]|uniref:hypothetical protein n=1 Tax=Clostridium senegalense TaxID=1465809 RepID=UPI001C1212C2|nr:hypothetical protein [Clostridium senegalense]MBU5228124.1 hypothetical protein [Clostridium senegalense]
MNKLILVILVWTFIGFLAFGRNTKTSIKVKKNSSSIYKKLPKVYEKLTKIPLVGTSLINIKRRLYINQYDSERVLRAKSVLYYGISWCISLVLFAFLFFIYRKDLYIVCVLALVCIYLRVIVVDILVGDDTKLLKEMVDFIKDLKHQFNLKGSTETALYEASKLAGEVMQVHAKNMCEAIKSKRALNTYCRQAPNKYIKLLTVYIYLTAEMGDASIDGRSAFITNMNYLMKQIKMEVDKRDKLKYWLKGINILTILPLAFTDYIKNWSLPKFPQATFFYNSSLDIMAKVILLIISMICFITIREIERNSDQQAKINLKKNNWEANLLKIKPIRKVVSFITPKKDTKEYIKMKNLIIDSGSQLKIDWIYLRKLVIALVAFIVVIFSIIGLKSLNVKNVMNNTSHMFVTSEDYITVGKEQLELTQIDRQILEENLDRNYTKEDLVQSAKSKGITDEKELNKLVTRVDNKLRYIENEHFKIYDLLLTILLSILATYIPNVKLYFEKKLRKIDMDSEVFEFYIIILLLMYHKRASIEMILDWMEKFSYTFKDPIRVCRNNLGKGVFKALNGLKETCKYKPFQRLVDNLIISEKIRIKDAFESLESERSFFETEQKELNERIVAEKRELGDLLGVVPALALITIYLLIPLGWASRLQFNSIYENLE